MLKRNGIPLGEINLTPYNPLTDESEQGDVYPEFRRNVIHFHFKTINAATFYSIEKNDKAIYPMPIKMQQGDQIFFIWKAEAVGVFNKDAIPKVEEEVIVYHGSKKNMRDRLKYRKEKRIIAPVAYATGHFSYMNTEDMGNFIESSGEKIYE